LAVNSITDINDSLVDDGLVDKAKIGGSNYFWSFPAKKDRLMQRQHEETLVQLEKLEKSVREATARLADAKRGREEDDDDNNKEETKAADDSNKEAGTEATGEVLVKTKSTGRAAKLRRLNEITLERQALESELAKLKENDPHVLADLEKELKLVTEAANRWTDNIFNCKTYLTKKRGMDRKDANRFLGITDTFDCKYICLMRLWSLSVSLDDVEWWLTDCLFCLSVTPSLFFRSGHQIDAVGFRGLIMGNGGRGVVMGFLAISMGWYFV